jgi:uncharacterized membrane protein YecN with MAPEG domain
VGASSLFAVCQGRIEGVNAITLLALAFCVGHQDRKRQTFPQRRENALANAVQIAANVVVSVAQNCVSLTLEPCVPGQIVRQIWLLRVVLTVCFHDQSCFLA